MSNSPRARPLYTNHVNYRPNSNITINILVTQPYAYQTDSKHPIVKVVDTSIKAGKSSDRPLHWTLPDSRLWFATLLPHNSTSVNSEDLKMSQSITSQPTVKRRSTILSTLPLTSRLYDVLTELPTSYESALASRDVAFS